MRAIITAAGFGSRMYPLCHNMPKCLLKLNGETILDRAIRILRQCGIDHITVVTGFHHDKVARSYSQKVYIRFNPHYEITGSAFSLWTVKDDLVEDTIVMNADAIFTKEPIEKLIQQRDLFCIAVDNNRPYVAEDRKIQVEGENVIRLSKTISPKDTFGAFIHIAKISTDGIVTFKDALYNIAKKDSQLNWPDTFNYLTDNGHNVGYIITNSIWADIDTEKDYNDAIKLFGKECLQ